MGLVKGCPHVLHAAWLWPPPATPGSLKPHVEEPLRVCRILNARTSVALCIRGKRKAEHARPCVLPFASTRRPPLAPPCSVCSCRGGSKRLHRCKLPPAQHVPNELTESFDHWESNLLRELQHARVLCGVCRPRARGPATQSPAVSFES